MMGFSIALIIIVLVFEVRDKDGKVLDTLTTDKNGHAESKELPICTYNEDGSFKEDIHYTVLETKAADGYILDGTAHDVTLRYDDNAPDVVVATLKLVNVPTEPKLPQTGDNANPLLYLGIGALALITGGLFTERAETSHYKGGACTYESSEKVVCINGAAFGCIYR